MSRVMRLETIVATVDALFGEAQLTRHAETRKQIALADRLVLTKTDLVPMDTVERLRAVLRDHNDMAPILVASHGAVDAALLLPPQFLGAVASVGIAHRSGFFAEAVDRDHTGLYVSLSLMTERPLAWRAFDGWLRTVRIGHAEQLLRVKGMLQIDGVDGPVVVQGLHHVMNAPVELNAWPNNERKSRLVLIADPGTITTVRESWLAALPAMTVG
jgi:G3E family GTPase